jgi:hypothetical protein
LAWASDFRVEDGSLETVEADPDPEAAEILRSAFVELRLHLQTFQSGLKIYTTLVRSHGNQYPEEIGCIFPEEILEVIRLLKSLVGSVRMVHAMKAQKGPYHRVKKQVDQMHQKHSHEPVVTDPSSALAKGSISGTSSYAVQVAKVEVQEDAQPKAVPPFTLNNLHALSTREVLLPSMQQPKSFHPAVVPPLPAQWHQKSHS